MAGPPRLVSNDGLGIEESSCVTREMFEGDSFDANEFVQWHRQRVPLDKLSKDLRGLSKSLKNQLLSLVNNEYSDFVELSSTLSHLQAASALRPPVVNLRENLKESCHAIDVRLGSLKAKQTRLLAALSSRQRLEAMQKVHLMLASISKLLSNADQSKDGLDDFLQRCCAIQRAAHQLQKAKDWVQLLSECEQVCPFVQTLNQELSRLWEHELAALEPCLLQALGTQNKPAFLKCLEAYSSLDQHQVAEKALKTGLVAPAVATSAATHLTTDKRDPTLQNRALVNFFDEMIALVDSSPVTMMLECGCGVLGYDFEGNVLWDEICGALVAKGSWMFSPGIPVRFHQVFFVVVRGLLSIYNYF
eukprot:c5855_g1_i2.p1 GENE.c5855_g1_i2~~c5855_g1_i2.p1  ORF type:complete len:361 (+),score=74.61 c5855_g1_i2:27-1109(+)